MAVATTDVLVLPQNGWTLLATAPVGPIFVKPHSTGRAWFLAIAAALPPVDLMGLPCGRFSGSGEDNHFRSDASLTENIYVRVPPTSGESANAVDRGIYFSMFHG